LAASRCPDACSASTRYWPEVSVSSVRVSETVNTATPSACGNVSCVLLMIDISQLFVCLDLLQQVWDDLAPLQLLNAEGVAHLLANRDGKFAAPRRGGLHLQLYVAAERPVLAGCGEHRFGQLIRRRSVGAMVVINTPALRRTADLIADRRRYAHQIGQHGWAEARLGRGLNGAALAHSAQQTGQQIGALCRQQ